MRFRFLGLDGDESASAASGFTYASFTKPLVVNNVNSGDITLGCTYSAGSLSGGTTYTSRGLDVDLGLSVVHSPLLGTEEIDVTQREVVGNMRLDLTAAQDVTFMDTVRANTTQAVGLVHGTTAGNIAGVFMGSCQLINPTRDDYNGRRLSAFQFRAVPGAATGNDEFRFWVK
jgi:hypothetical protein